MTWKHDERLNARQYKDADERGSFSAGYSDGYYGYPQWTSNERNWNPNAYSAGYWKGVNDAIGGKNIETKGLTNAAPITR